MAYYVGVDIGGTAVKIGIVRNDGSVLCIHQASVNFDMYKTPIIDTVIQELKLFLKNYKNIDVEGIGVSAAGQIDSFNGTVIGTCGSLGTYEGTCIKQRMEEEFQLPTSVMNDANCMVLAERWIGAATHEENVIAFTIGTGIGGGILVNGNLLTGKCGIAGEIGHMILHRDGIPCTCGNYGCFEQYASTSALMKKVKNHGYSYEHGKEVFEHMQEDVTLFKIVRSWMEDIAQGTASLIHLFNPSMVVIGGGVSEQKEIFLEPLRKMILAHCMPQFKCNLCITSADLGNCAGLVGAVKYFIIQEKSKD